MHINRLKAWKTPTANLFQVVVAEEFEVNPEPIGKVKMGVTHLTEEQRLELDRRLAKFSDRVTHTLGVANFDENDINVKEGYPLRTRPYRIAPGIFDDLKGEIDDLISKALKDYIRPTNQKGLRAFLGTAGYYQKFIPEFSQWAGPLFKVLKKGAPCSLAWDKHMCASFKHLISVLCHEHTLTLPRNNDKLELHTDASTMGIGAVLSIIREDMEKPVTYYSKGLTAAEKNYTVSELECIAVVKAIDHFAIHLLGHFFTVVNDHRALVAL